MTFASASQFHVYLPCGQRRLAKCLNSVLNVKAVVAAFNQEKALREHSDNLRFKHGEGPRVTNLTKADDGARLDTGTRNGGDNMLDVLLSAHLLIMIMKLLVTKNKRIFMIYRVNAKCNAPHLGRFPTQFKFNQDWKWQMNS